MIEISRHASIINTKFKYQTHVAKHNNIEYSKNQILVISRNNYGDIIALKINIIFVTSDFKDIMFYGIYHKLIKNTQVGIYLTESLNSSGYIQISNLLTPFPIELCYVNGILSTSLRQSIPF